MSTRPPIRTMALALTAAVALALTACGSTAQRPGSTGPDTSPTTSLSTQGPGTAAATEDSTPGQPDAPGSETEAPAADPVDAGASTGEVADVPVYYLVESPDGPRLAREFRTVPDQGDLITSAVMAMMSVPPKDPDYWTNWIASDEVTVSRTGETVTVDVPRSVFGTGIGAAYEGFSYQQLVYTVTAAAAMAGTPATHVVLLENGGPGEGWGHIGVGDAWTRGAQHDVLNQVWLLSPAEGQVVPAGAVTFRGYGTSFEANFVWRITGAGVDLTEPTTGSNGMGFGEFEFTVDLVPGTYSVTVENSSGADDFAPHTDSKTFVVR